MEHINLRNDYRLQSKIQQEFGLKDKNNIVLLNPDLESFLKYELIEAIRTEGEDLPKKLAYDSLYLLKKARVVSALRELKKFNMANGHGTPSGLEVRAMMYWNSARSIKSLLQ